MPGFEARDGNGEKFAGGTVGTISVKVVLVLHDFATWLARADNGYLTTGVHLDTLIDRYLATIESDGTGASES